MTGGTEFTVSGQNFNAFGTAVVGQFGLFLGLAQRYTEEPTCYVGGDETINLTATLSDCTTDDNDQVLGVLGWSRTTHSQVASGCTTLTW